MLSKIMEKLVANRLTWYIEKNYKLTNAQTGFRKNRSTVDPMARLQDAFRAISLALDLYSVVGL